MKPLQWINNYYFEEQYFDKYVPKNVKTLWKSFLMFGNFTRKVMEAPQGCYYSRGICGRMDKIYKKLKIC